MKKPKGDINVYTVEDGRFLDSDTKQLALEPPEVFEEILDQLKDFAAFEDTTALEMLLERFQDEAAGLPEEFEPEANQVAISAYAIREAVEKKDPETAAIEAMRLCFAAVRANLEKAVMHRARLDASWHRPKPSRITRLWRAVFKWCIINQGAKKPIDAIIYFKENHDRYENLQKPTFKVDGEPVCYEEKDGEHWLYMETAKRDHCIGFKHIEKLFYEVRKELHQPQKN